MLLTTTQLSQFSCSVRFMTLLLVFALISVSAQGEQKQHASSAELQKLIQAVAQNETLYRNLRLKLTCSEVAHAGWFLHDDSIKVKRQSTIALTVQGEKFAERTQTSGDFVKHLTGGLGWPKEGFRDSASRTVKEETPQFQIRTGTRTITSVFDGTSYQYFMEDKLSNQGATEPPRLEQDGTISDQSPGLTDLARPHMFLFEPAGPRVPLSVYLAGREAIRKYAGESTSESRFTTRIQITGRERLQGLDCTTVRIETFDANGKPRSRNNLWLAQDRNLIPIRKLHYSYRHSKDLPCSESRIETWQEVREGVWFPRKTFIERYDSTILRRELIQVTSWRNDYEVENIELNPQLPEDVFTRLNIPPDAVMKKRNRGNNNQQKKEADSNQ